MTNDRNREMPENRRAKRNGPLQKTIRFVFSLALLLLMLFAGVMEFLTLTEYRPAERERASVEPGGRALIGAGDSFTVVTWNCGYGALGDNADFFMDGGKSVNTADEERVRLNIGKIADALAEMRPNVIFLQEVDRDSDRSHGIEEVIELSNTLQQDYDMIYTSASAYNFNVRFVPFPIPPIGKVKSGLVTLSDALARDAERIQLPVPFKWPVRLANSIFTSRRLTTAGEKRSRQGCCARSWKRRPRAAIMSSPEAISTRPSAIRISALIPCRKVSGRPAISTRRSFPMDGSALWTPMSPRADLWTGRIPARTRMLSSTM